MAERTLGAQLDVGVLANVNEARDGPAVQWVKCRERSWGKMLSHNLCLNEVVPGTSVFPLSETGVLGDFWGRIKGAKYRFAFQDGTWDIF